MIVACLDSGVISAPLHDRDIGDVTMDVLCDACETAASTLQKLVKSGVSETIIVKTAIAICDGFDIEDKYICETIVPEFRVISTMIKFLKYSIL